MENQRKYFNYRIAQLEEIFARACENIGVLEELEEELAHRRTKRARELLAKVQSALNANTGSSPSSVPNYISQPVSPVPVSNTATPKSTQQIDDEIDWVSAFDNVLNYSPVEEEPADEPPTNDPLDILESWTSMEVLSPQTYKRPHDLQGSGSVAYFKDGEPWLRGEKSRPKCNLYYIIFLGAIELDKATENLISIYQDKRVERPAAQGKAALGAILVNKRGIPVPETGIALSSFGWAYGQALSGHIDHIKHWVTAEKILLEKLAALIYRQDKNGECIPLTIPHILHIYRWILHICKIPENDVVEPSFIIRLYQAFSKGEPETPLLNSFYLSDLQWASSTIQNGTNNYALSRYLGITKPPEQIDVLHDKSYLEDVLQPKHTPLGRWPGRGRFPLVLLQQAAVNFANRELSEQGLFSVNGPPGTGKTTILRDIVARNVVERAIALSAFEDVNDAFSLACKIRLGRGFVHLYKLSENIRGFEMLVASSNNKAVENISKELPLTSQIADDLTDFSYFKTISDALSDDDDETWGMIAAVLGNAKNRSNFISKVWWDDKIGLQTYFKAITGQLSCDPADYKDGVVPPVIEGCDAPGDSHEAGRRWQIIRREFKRVHAKAQEVNALAQKAYENRKIICGLEENLGIVEARIREQAARVDKHKQKLEHAFNIRNDNESELNYARQNLKEFKKSWPGFLSFLLRRADWRIWKRQFRQLRETAGIKKHAFEDADGKYHLAEKDYKTTVSGLDYLNNEKTELEKRYQQAIRNVQPASHICEGALVTCELWDTSHEEQQLFKPNFLEQAHRVRDDLFITAMKLHKAFIDAAAKQIRQNLSAFFFILGNGKLPPEKIGMIPHLWSSAFLFTPVISTTFASVGRMLNSMASGSLGWLLIDEAGQALPQSAVGAILRAKRVVVVGDPMQIEPVVTLPIPLVESIFKHYSVDPYRWSAPYSSVQTLSDEANPFGTSIPRELTEIWIGSPLLVHRRCEDPMFKISNKLAYNGQMVSATEAKESPLTTIFGKCLWFDINGSAQEKWCPEEGEFVAGMIRKAAKELGGELDLFVITPFKIVEQSMRRRMERETGLLEHYGIENSGTWISDRIGTVHTFQGKEAQGVILLLGAPDPAQNGARNWATANVNLLNVAVSRAKQNFYVVGSHKLWSSIGNMKTISRYLNKFDSEKKSGPTRDKK
ncbi:MAG: hypothetical protein GTO45_23750 [Candidatus Aminicenantes bacterium]|nr:hypothetical protein [Candidatus Aminicenantes bacterium]NIM81773.1 hypothetical protein [Candidatus Aminicenantes bacterium]NIN21145.1 hypothetical protein [Candidatus Aminicenantes bacterium]NIN44967.1 hypothetical protein [Candidatus Aminicenantes bacterium]NIN87781.1 hypothetical protein [Candidatus Aminicenantes bacterium]